MGKQRRMQKDRVRSNALRKAKEWAARGNAFMAQSFLMQAENSGYVSARQIAALNRLMENGVRKDVGG